MQQSLLPHQIDLWVEPFAGSSAVALALEGVGRPPFTYQGGKSSLAEPTLSALRLREGGRARRYLLNDLGPVIRFYRALKSDANAVARCVEGTPEGRAGYTALMAAPVPEDPFRFAAAYACLQASSVLGKPPNIRDGRWRCAGYAAVSTAASACGFRVRLNPRALSKRLRAVGARLERMPADFVQGDAVAIFADGVPPRTVVYIDPPYRGTTRYLHHASRADVIDMAGKWVERGAVVAIAEAEALQMDGGRIVELQRQDRRGLIPGRREFLTILGE